MYIKYDFDMTAFALGLLELTNSWRVLEFADQSKWEPKWDQIIYQFSYYLHFYILLLILFLVSVLIF